MLWKRFLLTPQMLPRLGWVASHYADGGLFDFVNILESDGTPMPYTDIGAQLASSVITWDDLDWIKQAWGDNGPIIAKGVMRADDAKRAIDKGVKVVSWGNHGARQEDGVPPALHIVHNEMPHVGEDYRKLADFTMDGGVRRGRHALIAISYGLQAVGIGRPIAGAVGAAGYEGFRTSS